MHPQIPFPPCVHLPGLSRAVDASLLNSPYLPPSQERFQKFTRDRTERLGKYEQEREQRLAVHENHKKEIELLHTKLVEFEVRRHMHTNPATNTSIVLLRPQFL